MVKFFKRLYDLFLNNIYEEVIKSPVRILPATFLVLCILGGILLYLPCSGDMTFIDALFTSVSGVCVTGLSVQDISSELNLFGQFILMLLIQVGGLGIMSISSVIFLLLGKKMSVTYEKNARSMFDAESRDEIKDSLFLIFKYTFLAELTGFIIFTLRFFFLSKDFFFSLKQALFLAISSFCNAGFALFSDNLISYNSDSAILLTVSLLIIAGGISPAIAITFPKILKREKLSPIAKIVFVTTASLLVLGTIFIFMTSYNGVLSGMSFSDKLLNAWFQSVSARTAGFSSIDLSNLSCGTYLALIVLMIIGGSPGGTAGGIKTTTFAVLVITSYNIFLGRKNIIRNREIPPETIYKAIALIFVYLGVIIVSCFILCTTQILPHAKLVFEVVSAMGTVGLSMGITSQLDTFGKMVIIITMFLGRVFPAMIIYYLNSRINEVYLSYPKAKISLT
ncbi:hypothetical protein IKQ26_07980 [bacterium]|nr:hypothetical protein [bacterium]